MDLFLKFESEAQATALLYNVVTEYRDENGVTLSPDVDGNYPSGAIATQVKQPKFANVDIIGDIYKPTGEMQEVAGIGETTVTVPVTEKLNGYHVNVRVVNEDASELHEFSVVPANPVRVWA